MNDYLTLYLPFGKELKAEFKDASGTVHSAPISTPKLTEAGAQPAPVEVELYID